MDLDALITIVSNNLFPIVCCFYMININNKTVKENTEVTRELKNMIQLLLSKEVNHDK